MTRARLGALLALVPILTIAGPPGPAHAEPVLPRGVLVVVVPGVSFDQLLADPEIRSLASFGGAAFMPSTASTLETLQTAFPKVDVFPIPTGSVDLELSVVEQGLGPAAAPLRDLGTEIRTFAGQFDVGSLLVLVVGDGTSSVMRGQKDELVPVVMAAGPPSDLFAASGEPSSLTSDSTRRSGVVVVDDLATTILEYVGHPIRGNPRALAETGAPIRVTDDRWPLELHERYLAQRRMYVPIGTAAALFVTGAGLVGVAFLALRRRVPMAWRRAAAWAALSVPMLATGLLAVGHLPELTYATAVPMAAIVAVFGTMAFSPLERRDPTLVLAGIGLTVLVLFAVEALLGWSGMLTPLLGGSELDGGRFYGLPNVGIGLLVGAALWVAQRLDTPRGTALLVAAGLFAGLPFAGANLGGAVTAFAAAGLWLAVRERGRLGPWRGVGAFLGVTVAGSAVILVAHAISPVETHVTVFERASGGIAGVLERYGDRLRVGLDLIAGNPAALVPVVGLPIVLLVVWRPPAPIRETFERWPAWRDAVLVTILAGAVAYLANDSGPAAAGLAFGLGLGGMLGVSLLSSAGKMEAR